MKENYFSNWSANMSYFLGLIFADGCVNPKVKSFGLGLVSTDDYLLDFLLKELESTNKIYKYKPTRKDINASEFSSIRITNKKIYDDLCFHGVIHRKSFNDIPFPTIPKKYEIDFLRGHFDGDGSIFKTSQGYYKISIVGTKKFMEGISKTFSNYGLPNKKVVSNSKSLNCYSLNYATKQEIINFTNLIYKSSSIPCLLRKKEIALEASEKLSIDLTHKGIDQRGKKWRVRWKGIEYGNYETFDHAIFVKDLVSKNIIQNACATPWQDDIICKLKTKGLI